MQEISQPPSLLNPSTSTSATNNQKPDRTPPVGMGKLLNGADKEVLVDIVRFTQKQNLKGAEGGWKDYLARHDKKLGSTVGDPARKPKDFLLAFLLTFPANFVKRLVRLTAEHPDYTRNYVFPSYKEGWEFITLEKLPEKMDSKSMIAIHCETVLCTDGTEELVRVCAVDQKLEVIMDRLVNPSKSVKNYRTSITGISAENLDGVTCSLSNVQKSLKKILKKGPVLIGHGLFNDLKALKIDYSLVVDTASIFSYANLATGCTPLLNKLGLVVLGEVIARNCLEEAKAAMRLVHAKLEHGFDHPINISSDSTSDHSKVSALPDLSSKDLLVHRVPVSVPYLELTRIFPGTPEIHDRIKVKGDLYSTFVKFKNSKEADGAYEALNGMISQDNFGRQQKVVVFRRENGEVVKVSVGKLVTKRLREDANGVEEERKDNSKKLKISHDPCLSEKEALAEIVRKTQRRGLAGSKGNWKEFLTSHDKKLGSSLSDPAKRDEKTLTAFLSTFSSHLQKYFDKMRKRHTQLVALEQHISKFPESESSELKLARLTAEYPDYRRNYDFPSYNEDWKVMKVGSVSNIIESKSIVAIDCEMVLCEDGTEAPVRVCAVDQNLMVLIDKYICPGKPVKDYRTHITGISAEDLDGVTCTLAKIQKSFRKILKKGTILIGHSLFFDLRALKIDYPLVIDTTCIFKHADLPPGVSPSLNNLCKAVLSRAVREEGETHDCLNDAKATMEIVLAKLKHGFNQPIKVSYVSESDLAKLKVHKVPVKVSCEELSRLLPGKPNVDKDVRVSGSGNVYATLVEFRNAKEAEKAFEDLDGDLNQDLCGRLQKRVSLRLGNGEMVTFNIRKMSHN
ncbi:uncharacterized protein LOC144546362 isoform X2 [Carex rostrata]